MLLIEDQLVFSSAAACIIVAMAIRDINVKKIEVIAPQKAIYK